jgi:hypothetical protein
LTDKQRTTGGLAKYGVTEAVFIVPFIVHLHIQLNIKNLAVEYIIIFYLYSAAVSRA